MALKRFAAKGLHPKIKSFDVQIKCLKNTRGLFNKKLNNYFFGIKRKIQI